jgi:predicted  nucleic acid-binding Zn-ribbon protein
MREDLDQLVRLQKLETDLKHARGELDEVPRRKAELEAELTAERARLDAARAALDEAQKARRRLESELADLESKRSRYKGQLMEVKTNKEYTAMLHEIEAVEREIRGREDQILAEMEKAETQAAEVKKEEALFKGQQERCKTDAAALDARIRALETEAARIAAERDAIAAALPPDTLELFQRVARLRGSGVAEARDQMCQVCHVKLRLQMFVEIKRNDQIFQCPACNRILYYEPPVPVSAPHP